MFACAVALERNPELVGAIEAAGLDICCHGRRWIRHAELTEAEERREIAEAVAILTRLTGAPPPGWYCRYAPSVNTRRLLVDHGGFLYDWMHITTSCRIGRGWARRRTWWCRTRW